VASVLQGTLFRARQQQRAQHHGDEDLDGGVDVALTGAAGGGKADGLGADGRGIRPAGDAVPHRTYERGMDGSPAQADL